MSPASSVSKDVVTQFWAMMQRNDFAAAGEMLHDAYVLEWPQSGERIRGRSNFVAVNTHYPAAGPWHFTLHRLLADDNEVVTDVTVTDGVTVGRAITFSTVKDGRILQQIEYWPDPYDAPAWRSQWIERHDT